MKTINELTEQEILSLTDNELATMVKIKMAEAGIKIIDTPREPDYIIIPPKDDSCYSINGFDFFFKDMEAAKALADAMMISKGITYRKDYRDDYNLQFLKKFTDDDYSFKNIGEIKTEQVYKMQTAYDIKEGVKANEKLKKVYEQELSTYKEAFADAEYIRDEIYNRYNEVKDRFRHFENMKGKFISYMELAQNNKDIAMNFLEKAYAIDEETKKYILA